MLNEYLLWTPLPFHNIVTHGWPFVVVKEKKGKVYAHPKMDMLHKLQKEVKKKRSLEEEMDSDY